MSSESGGNGLIRGRTDLRDTVLITHPRHTSNTIICLQNIWWYHAGRVPVATLAAQQSVQILAVLCSS